MRHPFILSLSGLAALLATVGGPAAAPSTVSRLRSLQDKARPILVLSDSADDPRIAKQIAAFDRAKPGLDERDIAVLREARPGSALRKVLGVAPTGFAVVLVGKDGGVKKVWHDPVDPARIFTLIDAMPMRRREMKG